MNLRTPAARPRIGMFMPGGGTGGPWRYVHSLLAAIDLREFAVTLFSDLPAGYPPRPEVEVVVLGAAPGCPANGGPPAGGRSRLRAWLPQPAWHWAGFARQTARLARVIRGAGVDLLHTNNTGCEESPVAARLAGVPRVLGTFHVDTTYDLHGERDDVHHRAMAVLSNRCLDRAIAVSHATGRDWITHTRMPAARVTTIRNGVDPVRCARRWSQAAARLRLGLPADGRLILGGVGRLDEAKGFADLIAALPRLRAAHPDLTLVLAGEGPLRPVLTAQAARLGLGDAVRLLGYQADVQLVLDALDVFVLPSHCEALPFALLEAMATGLPAVGTRVGGVPEIIVPGETGELAPRGRPQALASALAPLLASAALRQRLGEAGRARVVTCFSEEQMVRRTLQLYRTMLGNRELFRPAMNQETE